MFVYLCCINSSCAHKVVAKYSLVAQDSCPRVLLVIEEFLKRLVTVTFALRNTDFCQKPTDMIAV